MKLSTYLHRLTLKCRKNPSLFCQFTIVEDIKATLLDLQLLYHVCFVSTAIHVNLDVLVFVVFVAICKSDVRPNHTFFKA